MKIMETMNVAIDESSDSSSEKGIKELPKEILPHEHKELHLHYNSIIMHLDVCKFIGCW